MTEKELLHSKLNLIINALVLMPNFIAAAASGSNKHWRRARRDLEKQFNAFSEEIKKYEATLNDNDDTASVEDEVPR